MRTVSLGHELTLIDLALFLPTERALAIADVHLGIEDALQGEGVLVPRDHLAQVQQRLRRIFDELHVTPSDPLRKILINGDLRHQFGPLSRVEHRESKEFLRWLAGWAEHIILIEGNHDGSLAALAGERVVICKSYSVGDCWFVHGDSPSPSSPLPSEGEGSRGVRGERSWIVIGHEHPAVGLRDPITQRVEVYKCFLVGRFAEKNLLVLPSFNQLVKGSDLLKEQPLSPVVRSSALEDFFVYVVSDAGDIYEFGPLHRLLIAL